MRDSGPPPLSCDPGANEAVWVNELDPINIDVVCRSGLDTSELTFELSSLPEGAQYDPATHTISWEPQLNQAALYNVRVNNSEYDEEGSIVIGVADAYDHPENVPPLDPSAYTMEHGLPVVWIDSEPDTDEWTPIGFRYRGESIEAKGKIRGKTSRTYPKRSFAFKFDDDVLDERDVADFRARKRMVMTSTFDDNSYIRQRFAYELWNKLEPTISIQTFSAVLYIDGVFHGLYTVSDHPNDDHMERSGLSPLGNLYKAENHDANFASLTRKGEPKATMHDGYSKTEGLPEEGEPDAFADLDEIVTFVATASDDDFNALIGDKIHIDDYHKWFMLVTFLLAEDSAGKNSYHYHNPLQSWRVAPWDFNHSFGQTWQTLRKSPDSINLFEGINRLFVRLGEHPQEGPKRDAMFLKALSQGPFSQSELLKRYDELIEETKGVAERDWRKWETDYRNFERWSDRTDLDHYDAEVNYVRNWLSSRAAVFSDLYASPEGQSE